jgi:hypothetical protein
MEVMRTTATRRRNATTILAPTAALIAWAVVRSIGVDPVVSSGEGTVGPVGVRLTVYPGADHDAWSQTYDLSVGHDVYTWLLGHKRQ